MDKISCIKHQISLILGFLGFFNLLSNRAYSQQASVSIEEVKTKLAYSKTLATSASATFIITSRLDSTQTTTYLWKYKNKKTYFEITKTSSGTPPVRNWSVGDDKQSDIIQLQDKDDNTKSVGRSLGSIHNHVISPVSMSYRWSQRWISDIVNEQKFEMVEEEVDPKFGRVVEIKGTTKDNTNLLLKLAVEHDYMLVYGHETGFLRGQKMDEHTQVTDFLHQGDYCLPTQAKQWGLTQSAKSGTYAMELLCKDLSFAPISNAVFSTKYPEGSRIYDNDTRYIYKVNAKGELTNGVYVPLPKEDNKRLLGIVFIVSTTCLIISVLLGVLRWKNRKTKISTPA